jgi:hypothetical protein
MIKPLINGSAIRQLVFSDRADALLRCTSRLRELGGAERKGNKARKVGEMRRNLREGWGGWGEKRENGIGRKRCRTRGGERIEIQR